MYVCFLYPATNRLLHVCSPALLAQSATATSQDSGAMLLSAILGAPSQNGALPSDHASPE